MEPEPKEKVYRNDYTNQPTPSNRSGGKPNDRGERKDFKNDRKPNDRGDRKDFKSDRGPKSTTKESTPKRPARKISGKVFKDAKKGK